ncbi:uncharacterized protein TNCV_1392931 [Trichonephila clavipes]|nr:uncharacterized protein TNCV_1392931 [Trichonephila clavipes]
MESNFATKLFNKFQGNSSDPNTSCKQIIPRRNWEDYLPDGSCFSRVLKIEPQIELSNESTIKKCEYVGSFPVSGSDQNERTEFVRNQLKQMRDSGPKKSVLLVLSLTGIKVCCSNGKKQGTQQLEIGPGCEETQKGIHSIRSRGRCCKWGGASSGKGNETNSPRELQL